MTAGMVLVTGAGGFVGRTLVPELRRLGWRVAALTRAAMPFDTADVHWQLPATGDSTAVIRDAVRGCDVIVHLAARVHTMVETASDPLVAYRATNLAFTMQVADAAAAAGVRRFVFVSTAKVSGERGAFSEHDRPVPTDPYSISKLEAETALFALGVRSGMEVVVVRPPLVYGPGVRANFRQLVSLVRSGLPMPFGALANRRSLVAVQNLTDLLTVCCTHPRAAGDVFFVSDRDDVSTAELARRIGTALGRRARIVNVSPLLLRLVARLLGKSAMMHRLAETFVVDSSKALRVLGWSPPMTMDQALRFAVGENAT